MSDPARTLKPTRSTVGSSVAQGRYSSGVKDPVRPIAVPQAPPPSPGHRVAYVLGDVFFVCLTGLVVFYLRFVTDGHVEPEIPVFHYLGFLVLYAALVGFCCQSQGLYQTWRTSGPLDESFSALKAVVFASLFLTAFIYLSNDKFISRLVVGISALLNAITLPAWRFWKREIVKHQVASGMDGRHVLIVGAGDVGHALARHLEEKNYLGYVVKGFVDSDRQGNRGVIGDVSDIPRLALLNFVDEVFITTPSKRELVDQVVLQARENHLDVKLVPELFDGLWKAPIRYIGDFPVMELLREPIPSFGLLIKRVIDVVGSATALVVLAPIMGLIAVVIRVDSQGPAIYRSWRVGWKGRKFRCYKFRTMVQNADMLKDSVRHLNEREGPFFKVTHDPRQTGVGRFLRRFSLDELPQFFNVLKGEMSLVGPRPHPLDDFEKYQIEHLRRLDVKPGVTGLWQVYARRDPSFERNLALDLEYIENWSLWLDTKILLKTLAVALNGSGQ
jgi:exopolysaccharide biosynthesis polyprenyl glycosylphosphotransferase